MLIERDTIGICQPKTNSYSEGPLTSLARATCVLQEKCGTRVHKKKHALTKDEARAHRKLSTCSQKIRHALRELLKKLCKHALKEK